MSHSINKALVAHIERFHPTYTPHEKKEVYHVLKKLENNQKKQEAEDPLFGEKAYRNHVRNTQRNYNKKKYPQYHRMNNNYFTRAVRNEKEDRRVSAIQKQKLSSNKKHVKEQALQKRLQKEINETHKALRNQYCAPGQPKMFGMMCGKPPPTTSRARSPRKKYAATSAAKP